MQLTLIRRPSTDAGTLGQLAIDGTHECFTFEDVVRPEGVKVPGKTAIPAGRYRVIIDLSRRFGRLMPLLLDVPGFTGIRIHTGNTQEHTEGCILVGRGFLPDRVTQSQLAYDALFPKLQAALAGGSDVWIDVSQLPSKVPMR